jgi:AraC-like DNA-binding protein
MKVFPFKIPKSKEASLMYQEDRALVFYDKLHQHEEIQVSYIKKGEGTLIVGDSITTFQKNDIIVLGSNLPHVFRSDRLEDNSASIMQTVFFTGTTFGRDFFDLPEFKSLSNFFTHIQCGLLLENVHPNIAQYFDDFKKADEYDRISIFLGLIRHISTAEYTKLSNFIYDKPIKDNEGKRMRMVFEYVMSNYAKSISLDDVAKIASMTKNAFCRYFKVRTNKTFFQFLIEIRVEHAAKLLIKDNELSVLEIAELCGFTNISNFNRQFKATKGETPMSVRKRAQSIF